MNYKIGLLFSRGEDFFWLYYNIPITYIMSGFGNSKTINNESSVVNSGTNLVVNSVTTLSSTEAITAKGSITITPSSSTCSLYLDNYYIRRDNFNNITYFATGDKMHAFWTNNTLRMYLDSGSLVTTVPIFAGTNPIFAGALYTNSIASSGTVGPLVIDPNFTTNNYVQINDSLVVNGNMSATNINSANYGSAGGNLSIASPFTLNLSASNSCDTNFYCNRVFFNTQGGTITTAINWGSTANSGSYSMTVNGVVYAWGSTLGSDDRIKGEEEFITGATETLLKLRPQTYNKYNDFSCSGDHIKESGLVAQEVWYDAPELRHIVTHSNDATIDPEEYIPSSTNPTNDPAGYSSWGSNPAGVSYTMLIPFLVKSIQELNARIHALEHP